MGKTYGFGIVGCGAISKWHVAAIDQIENAKLIGVFNTPKEFAEDFAKKIIAECLIHTKKCLPVKILT